MTLSNCISSSLHTQASATLPLFKRQPSLKQVNLLIFTTSAFAPRSALLNALGAQALPPSSPPPSLLQRPACASRHPRHRRGYPCPPKSVVSSLQTISNVSASRHRQIEILTSGMKTRAKVPLKRQNMPNIRNVRQPIWFTAIGAVLYVSNEVHNIRKSSRQLTDLSDDKVEEPLSARY